MTRVEISDLPARHFQRDYIDHFFKAQREGREYRIEGRKVVQADYGHCENYPVGFFVYFE